MLVLRHCCLFLTISLSFSLSPGTWMHYNIERHINGLSTNSTELAELEQFRQFYDKNVTSKLIEPFRTEWWVLCVLCRVLKSMCCLWYANVVDAATFARVHSTSVACILVGYTVRINKPLWNHPFFAFFSQEDSCARSELGGKCGLCWEMPRWWAHCVVNQEYLYILWTLGWARVIEWWWLAVEFYF